MCLLLKRVSMLWDASGCPFQFRMNKFVSHCSSVLDLNFVGKNVERACLICFVVCMACQYICARHGLHISRNCKYSFWMKLTLSSIPLVNFAYVIWESTHSLSKLRCRLAFREKLFLDCSMNAFDMHPQPEEWFLRQWHFTSGNAFFFLLWILCWMTSQHLANLSPNSYLVCLTRW